ncbi:glycosyltransferase [Lacinutrix gracilariae]|uniref:Glycosyltransferase n=1 Tax=Lacinutrix gracilariae TaxID=1747198 RepID=A0ABW5K584_9FLAO
MNKNSDLIIVIPYFNDPVGIKTSIDSITEEINIDIIIVDDGSKTKFHEEDIKSCYTKGEIHFVYLQENLGIEHALNKGLKTAQDLKYKYIARLDCGDKCKPNKFKKQLDYLNQNPDVKLLGTWVNVVDEQGNHLHYIKHPVSYVEIKKKMYLNSMFVHPSVIFSTSIIDSVGYYPVNYKAAEDYAFFFKIIKKFKAENYPEVLLDYELNENSISSTKRKIQVQNRIKIIKKHFYFGITPIYGILRNYILLYVSREGATKIKKLLNKS